MPRPLYKDWYLFQNSPAIMCGLGAGPWNLPAPSSRLLGLGTLPLRRILALASGRLDSHSSPGMQVACAVRTEKERSWLRIPQPAPSALCIPGGPRASQSSRGEAGATRYSSPASAACSVFPSQRPKAPAWGPGVAPGSGPGLWLLGLGLLGRQDPVWLGFMHRAWASESNQSRFSPSSADWHVWDLHFPHL